MPEAPPLHTLRWRRWLESPPPKELRVIIAHAPDGIWRFEPAPVEPPIRVEDMPLWRNVANLMWRPASA